MNTKLQRSFLVGLIAVTCLLVVLKVVMRPNEQSQDWVEAGGYQHFLEFAKFKLEIEKAATICDSSLAKEVLAQCPGNEVVYHELMRQAIEHDCVNIIELVLTTTTFHENGGKPQLLEIAFRSAASDEVISKLIEAKFVVSKNVLGSPWFGSRKKFALPLLGMLQSRAGAPEAIANVFIELRDDEKREWADMILEFDEPFRSQLAERCAFAEIHFRAASDTFVASLFPFVDLGKIAQRRIPPSPTLVLSPMARVAELSREASISDDWMQVQSLLLERKEFFIGDLRQLRMAINFFKDSRNYYMLDWLERNGFPLDNIVKLDEQYQFYVACLHADESELNAAFATSGKKVTYFADVQQLWPSRSNRLDSAPETATEPAPYKATALEFLIQSNHRPIARLLLEKGEYQIALPSWDIVERTKSDPELSVIYSKMLRLNPKRNNLSGAQQRAATEVDRTFLETIYGPQFDMKAIEANEDHLEIFDRSADEFLLKAIEDDNNALLDFAFRRLKDDFRVGKLPLTANRRGKPILFDVLMDNPDQLFEMAKNKPHFLNRLLAEGLYPSHDFEPGPDSLENNSISRALQHAKMVREEYGTRQNR